jgi:hypothetical protein
MALDKNGIIDSVVGKGRRNVAGIKIGGGNENLVRRIVGSEVEGTTYYLVAAMSEPMSSCASFSRVGAQNPISFN